MRRAREGGAPARAHPPWARRRHHPRLSPRRHRTPPSPPPPRPRRRRPSRAGARSGAAADGGVFFFFCADIFFFRGCSLALPAATPRARRREARPPAGPGLPHPPSFPRPSLRSGRARVGLCPAPLERARAAGAAGRLLLRGCAAAAQIFSRRARAWRSRRDLARRMAAPQSAGADPAERRRETAGTADGSRREGRGATLFSRVRGALQRTAPALNSSEHMNGQEADVPGASDTGAADGAGPSKDALYEPKRASETETNGARLARLRTGGARTCLARACVSSLASRRSDAPWRCGPRSRIPLA